MPSQARSLACLACYSLTHSLTHPNDDKEEAQGRSIFLLYVVCARFRIRLSIVVVNIFAAVVTACTTSPPVLGGRHYAINFLFIFFAHVDTCHAF